ncbi:MAG: ABC transporter substrate-binding protein [Telluria sp.]|nr:ABC transporter substrate-binding protein [Telluria sp.]
MHLNKMLATALVALGTMVSAQAAEDLKIGMILPMTGPFAAYGQQIESGARLYLAKHGDTVAGRKVTLIVRDDTGIAPEISKRHAQELLVNEHVDILAGFGLTPSAFSVAPLSVQTKKPMLVLNAATSAVTTKSPYIVRTSFTLPQTTAPLATWAARNGIKKVYTVVADYGPGHDSEAQFKKSFTAAGGQIVGEVRTPVKNPDFAPFLQRVKDSKPDAVFLFVPSGEQGVAFVKGYAERALAKAGIKLIATGDLTDEFIIDAMGDASLGMITSFHYAESHKSPENKAYVEAYAKAHPGKRASFMSVAGYDGMHVIFEALKKTGGDAGGDKFIAAASSLKWMSPRGPVRIDPATRDIVQTIYIRKVEKVNGKLQNVEFDQVADFKDPGKQ